MKPTVKFLLLLSLLCFGLYLFTWGPLRMYATPSALRDLLQKARGEWWLPLVFIAMYAVGGLVAFPGSVATLVGGVIFGVGWGSLFNWIGANLNALCGFCAARYLGRDFARRLARGRLARFDTIAEQRSFQTILYARLIPLLPFNAINIGAGLARIRLREYMLATAIGIIPGCLIYTYFAAALITGSFEARRSSYLHLIVASILLVVLSIFPRKFSRRKSGK